MPWKNKSVIDMKKEIMAALAQGQESVSSIALRYSISRKTLYKWKRRYEQEGEAGLHDRSRRPDKADLLWNEEVASRLIKLRLAHMDWGAQKLHAFLRKQELNPLPSPSAIQRFLKKSNLIQTKKKRERPRVNIAKPVVRIQAPNELWTVDFKGWWRSNTNARMTALTIRDAHSRFLLDARFVCKCGTQEVKAVFEECFKKYGLPQAIQSDNGPPFRSVVALGGLSALSAWWASLGISLIRSRPGCPQDNGAHERMHRDMLLLEANRCSSQAELDAWRESFNCERPHAALGNAVPADVYRKSERRYSRELCYKYHGMLERKVAKDGSISLKPQRQFFLSTSLRGHTVGLLPRDDGEAFGVYLYEIFLGEYHPDIAKFISAENLALHPAAGARPLGSVIGEESSSTNQSLASNPQPCNLSVTLEV